MRPCYIQEIISAGSSWKRNPLTTIEGGACPGLLERHLAGWAHMEKTLRWQGWRAGRHPSQCPEVASKKLITVQGERGALKGTVALSVVQAMEKVACHSKPRVSRARLQWRRQLRITVVKAGHVAQMRLVHTAFCVSPWKAFSFLIL